MIIRRRTTYHQALSMEARKGPKQSNPHAKQC